MPTSMDLINDLIAKIDSERASVQPVTPDEEMMMHAEDQLHTYLINKGIDPAPLMTRIYEMLLSGFRTTTTCGCDFAYGLTTPEYLKILEDFGCEVKDRRKQA